jgi:hypothetical protein
MATGTTEKARPLNADERRALAELLARSGQRSVPAHREGQRYQALMNLSVPRRGDTDKQCDLVPAGETVTLTDDEAELFMPPVKPVAMIRPVSEQGEPFHRIQARQLAGRIRIPAHARPDPEGATSIIETNPVPEATPAVIGSEQDDPSLAAQASEIVDAMDLKVRR